MQRLAPSSSTCQTIADNGSSALFASHSRHFTWEFHLLDLASRQVNRWLTIRIRHFDPSDDGITLTVVDMGGTLFFFDVNVDHPSALWTALREVGGVVASTRAFGTPAAVVHIGTGPSLAFLRLEQGVWQLPDLVLRLRRLLEWAKEQSVLTVDGVFLRLDFVEPGTPSQHWVLRAYERGAPIHPAITSSR